MLRVLEIALSYVGYHEKASNNSLDDFTANSGNANYNKFSKYLDDIGYFYNGPKNGYMWCDCFVDACMVMAYGVDRALELLCQPKYSAGAGCLYSAQYYKQKGQFFGYPKVGDQIFFSYASGEVSHTGLVYNVDSTYVYTVEGNTSDQVAKRKYVIGASTIYGYGRPGYSTEELNGTVTNDTSITDSKPTTYIEPVQKMSTELMLVKKGFKGAAVGALQWMLVYHEYLKQTDVDGLFGDITYKAVVDFQTANNLKADGEVGSKTWAKLING